jgi:hypothetical protein
MSYILHGMRYGAPVQSDPLDSIDEAVRLAMLWEDSEDDYCAGWACPYSVVDNHGGVILDRDALIIAQGELGAEGSGRE